MTTRVATRTAVAAAASLTVLAPLSGCSFAQTLSPAASSLSATPDAGLLGPSTASGVSEYTDGTYTVRGVYGGAPSYMTITITLDDDTITAVWVEPMPDNNDTSRGYQERFAAAVPDEVIGKSIDDLEVGIIAGASGCADGFNDALAKIRDQAATS